MTMMSFIYDIIVITSLCFIATMRKHSNLLIQCWLFHHTNKFSTQSECVFFARHPIPSPFRHWLHSVCWSVDWLEDWFCWLPDYFCFSYTYFMLRHAFRMISYKRNTNRYTHNIHTHRCYYNCGDTIKYAGDWTMVYWIHNLITYRCSYLIYRPFFLLVNPIYVVATASVPYKITF